MSYVETALKDICISVSDGDHQAPPKSDNGVPFITISNITSQNQLDFTNTMFVPRAYYEQLDIKRRAQKNDILYSVVGSFGIPVFMRNDAELVFQRHIAILRPNAKKVVPEYLYYVMLNRDFYMMADAAAIGAAQRTVTLTALRNMKITLPTMDRQSRIAEILSTYDNLIENNRKQIALLEEAAQRLYREYFVDLRFPGYENTKIVDGVPEVWGKELVGNLIAKVPRTKQIKVVDYLSEGVLPIIDQSREFVAGYTDDKDALVNTELPIIVFGDHTRILKYIQFPFAKGADGTQLIISNTTRMPQSLFYFSLVAVDLSDYHYARHFKYLKAEEIFVPPLDIANKFDKFASPILLRIQKLRDTSNKLSEARDRLLPKLMSGEITV